MRSRRGAAPSSLFCVFVAACGAAPPAPEAKTPADGPAASATAAPADAPKTAAGAGKTIDDHKKDFLNGCTAKMAGANDYCECSWQQMTALFTVDDMNNGSAQDPRFVELKTRVGKNCLAKLPEPALHTQFVAECASSEPRLGGYCECTYTELRKGVPVEAMVDVDAFKSEKYLPTRRSAAKACSAKMPEDVVKTGFLKGCEANEALKPFCACAWKTARASASPAEIEASLFDEAAVREKIKKACAASLPPKPGPKPGP